MGKTVWNPGTVLYPVPAVMVSCGTMDAPNIITIAWTGTISTNPPMTYISLRKSRFSYELIKNSGEFVINLTTESLAFATDYCGVKSGRDTNKFLDLSLTPFASQKVAAPSVYESPVNIECRVKEVIDLGGTHQMFVADVVSVSVSDEFFDETGKFHFERSKPICYSHGEYYPLGESLGTFGYSVRKKRKEPRKKGGVRK